MTDSKVRKQEQLRGPRAEFQNPGTTVLPVEKYSTGVHRSREADSHPNQK